MSRLLLIALVAACASSPAHPRAVDTRIEFKVWQQRWVPARACLVDPATDLETGVTSAHQSGRDCSPLLHSLDEQPRVVEPLIAMWQLIRQMIRDLESEAFTPSKRAIRILDLDRTMFEFGLLVDEFAANP